MRMLVKKLLAHTFLTSLAIGLSGTLAVSANAGARSYADLQGISVTAPGQSATSKTIVIPYRKSTTVDLPGGMADVIVSNPDIIGARVHTSSRVLLTGKKPGQTKPG